MPIVDASVYVSLINSHEDQHATSWRWFEQAQSRNEKLAAPVILLPEVGAALSRGLGDTDLALRAMDQLRESNLIELVPVTQPLAEQAAAIAAVHQVRGCDAIYVAVAKSRDDTLVTLDRQQLERSAAVIDVRQP
jgi:predicted nucleic acid-binding protein